jgi:hypothetical protein
MEVGRWKMGLLEVKILEIWKSMENDVNIWKILEI